MKRLSEAAEKDRCWLTNKMQHLMGSLYKHTIKLHFYFAAPSVHFLNMVHKAAQSPALEPTQAPLHLVSTMVRET